MSCDLCGCNKHQLTELRSIYQTEEIRQICPSCEKIVNKHLSKVQSMTCKMIQSLMKVFIIGRKKV